MKQLISSFVLGCVLFCIGGPSVSAQSGQADSTNLSGEWYLQPVLPSDTSTGHIPTLMLNLAQRKFTGFTGCNQMSGNFRVEGNTIVFGENVMLTKMLCVGYNEKDFVANLLRVNSYTIVDGVLTLQIDKAPVSKWRRKGDTKQTI